MIRLTRRQARAALHVGTACAMAVGLLFTASGRAADARCEAGRSLGDGLCLATAGTLDLLGVIAGGVSRGNTAQGVVGMALAVDLQAVAGMEGWRAQISAFGIAGRQITPTRVGSLASISNVEAAPTVRLYELWVEREVEGLGSIRFGQLAADTEFAVVENASKLVNSTFGWPVSLAVDLPSGGPAYPLATPGARLALGDPDRGSGLRFGIFSGDPGGDGNNPDPQRRNRYGTTFSTTGGAFMIAEAVTGISAPAGGPRPWVAKLGGWLHTGEFTGLRSNGAGGPRQYDLNWGVYGTGEITLMREGEQSLALFARGFTSPGDRNLVSLQLDAGLAWRAPLGQVGDTLSLGVSRSQIGASARRADRDLVIAGLLDRRRSEETVIELNYDREIIERRLWVRPLVQYVINPGAGAPDARVNARRPVEDAWVVGLRLTASY